METWGIVVLLVGMGILLAVAFVLLASVRKLTGKPAPAAMTGAESEPAVPEGIPGEVVAAIAAVVAALTAPSGKAYAVRSIRRAPEQSAWARAARMEQTNNRI